MSSVAAPSLLPDFTGPAASVRARLESSLGEHLSATLLLRQRAAPLTVPIGIAALDAITGGLPRGALSEFVGPASSGRTGAMLAALARATRRQEVCALVDATDSFAPAAAAAAGVNLEQLLWVRCNPRSLIPRRTQSPREPGRRAPAPATFPFSAALEQVLKVTDLLLQGGGFGMVVLDLADIPAASLRRIPLTSWFRFRRAVEPTSTVLLLLEQEACAKTCASLVLRLRPESLCTASSRGADAPHTLQLSLQQTHANNGKGESVSHAQLLQAVRFQAEVARKPPQRAGTNFELRSAWGR